MIFSDKIAIPVIVILRLFYVREMDYMKHTSLYLKRTLSAVMAFIMVFGVFSSAGIIGLVARAADGARAERAV